MTTLVCLSLALAGAAATNATGHVKVPGTVIAGELRVPRVERGTMPGDRVAIVGETFEHEGEEYTHSWSCEGSIGRMDPAGAVIQPVRGCPALKDGMRVAVAFPVPEAPDPGLVPASFMSGPAPLQGPAALPEQAVQRRAEDGPPRLTVALTNRFITTGTGFTSHYHGSAMIDGRLYGPLYAAGGAGVLVQDIQGNVLSPYAGLGLGFGGDSAFVSGELLISREGLGGRGQLRAMSPYVTFESYGLYLDRIGMEGNGALRGRLGQSRFWLGLEAAAGDIFSQELVLTGGVAGRYVARRYRIDLTVGASAVRWPELGPATMISFAAGL